MVSNRTALTLAMSAGLLSACAGINIQQPVDNQVVFLPSPTHVVVAGSAPYTNLVVRVDNVDFSSLMSTSGQTSVGDLPLAAGSHVVAAQANVSCGTCAGGSSVSTSSHAFVVQNPAVCARSPSPPVITLTPSVISVGRTPGQQKIAYQTQSGDQLLILVDDAPGLSSTQMLVAVDLDPVNGVTGDKAIEAWPFCHTGSNAVGTVKASKTGNACNALSAGNNFISGCTTASPAMMINQGTTSELWLRKQQLLGLSDVEAIDASIWQAFGGRSLRFIWRHQ